jgi:hypothetical protein
MHRTLVTCLLLAAFVVAAGLGAAPATPVTSIAPELDRAVAVSRWRSLTPGEQALMRERYERFTLMNAAERERLCSRAERLDQLTRRIYTALEPDVRRRVDSLAPERRRALLREMAAQEAHETSLRILRKLPADVRRRVENATPEDRARYLRDFKRQVLRVDRGLERLGPDIGLTAADIERLKEKPEALRREKFLELVQRRFDRWVERHELPEGLTPEAWRNVRAMAPADFLSAVMRVRESHPEFGSFPVRGGGTRAGLRRLQGAMRLPAPTWLELEILPASERRRERDRLLRERAMQVIREEALVGPSALRELAAAPDARFFVEVRSLLSGRQSDAPREHEAGDE